MANSLLDFVMSLVRDPAAAAQYAADPAQAIAAANLTDVTSVDVDQLIPMVTESLSSPVQAADAFGADVGANVWTSGAATAAFDAFDVHLPEQVVDHPVIDDVFSTVSAGSTLDADLPPLGDPALPEGVPVIDDFAFDELDPGWVQPATLDGLDHHIDQADDLVTPDDPGFNPIV